MLYFGIDIGKFFHVLSIVDEKGSEVASLTFGNNRQGIDELFALVDELTDELGIKPTFAMEATGHFWVPLYEQLLLNGYEVKVINPLQSNRFRDYYIQPIKNDRRDAFVIANMLRFGQLTETRLADPKIRNLRKLVRYRDLLTRSQVRIKNQIRAVLDEAFPEYQQVPIFSGIFGMTSLALLKKYPTPSLIKELPFEELTNFLLKVSRGRVGASKAKLILLCSSSSICSCSLTSFASNILLPDLICQLEDIQKRVEKITRLIEDILKTTGETLTTIPGMGTTLAATIISEIGDISRFESADSLLAYCGLFPSSYDSGTFKAKAKHMAKRGLPQLSQAFYKAAILSIRLNPHLALYYQKKIAEGCTGKRAVIAVARKLVRIVYALMKNNNSYVLPKDAQDNSGSSFQRYGN